MIGLDPLVQAGAGLVVVIRVTAALAAGRARAGDWPLWRCGVAVPALLIHDAGLGCVLFGAIAVLPAGLVAGQFGATGSAASAVAGLGTVLVLVITPLILERRRGIRWLRPPGRARRTPRPTVRDTLLLAIERGSHRATSRWIAARAERSRHRGAVTPELLLPALWPSVRMLLRDTVGERHTGVALLLLQGQAVINDAAPAQDRLLTLLHLVHQGSGRSGVRQALEDARRSPVRQIRPGAAAWLPSAAEPAAANSTTVEPTVPVPVPVIEVLAVPGVTLELAEAEAAIRRAEAVRQGV